MKIMQKTLALLLAVVLLLGLAACGQSNNPSDSSTSQDEVSDVSTDSQVVAGTTESSTGNAEDSNVTQADPSNSSEDSASGSGATKKGASATTKKGAPTKKTTVEFGKRTTGTRNKNIPKVIDMKGATIILGTKWETDWGNGKAGTSATEDKRIAWRKNFEKTYNCTLKNVVIPAYTLFQSISTKLMSGDKVADIMTMQLFDIEGFRHAGLLQPLQKSAVLDLDNDSVLDALVDEFTFNNNSYAYFSGSGFTPEVNGMFYNVDMIKELGLEDPLELVQKKKWTWAAFDKMCEAAYKDLNKNNKIDSADRFGACINVYQVGGSIRVSNDPIISYKNGNFSYTFNTPTTLKYLNTIKETFKSDKKLLSSDQYEQREKIFAAGRLLFCGSPSNTVNSDKHVFYSADFEYGYLPCPTLEEGMEYANSCSTWLCGYTIPVNTKQYDNIGYVLNAVTEMNNMTVADNMKDAQKQIGGSKKNLDILYPIFRRFTKDVYCWQDQFKVCMEQNLGSMLENDDITPAYYLDSIDSLMMNAVKDYYSKDPDCMK